MALVGDARWVVSGQLTLGQLGSPAPGEPIEELATGALHIDTNAELNAQSIFAVSGSRITGSGTIVSDMVDTFGFVTIEPDIIDTSSEEKQASAGAVLTIDGNLIVDGGLLAFDMGGTAASETDLLVVTGDATISNAIIRMAFVEEYLPSTGETAPVVMAGGALTFEDPTLEFEGVAEGFDFEVVDENGMLMFKALNDAQAISSARPRCASLGGRETAHRSDVLILLAVVAGLLMVRRRAV